MSTIRQRRQPSREEADDDHDNILLDQDDQAQVIQKLRQEAQDLDQHMNRVITIAAVFLIGGFWMLILASPGPSKWPFVVHGLYASMLCMLSASSFTSNNNNNNNNNNPKSKSSSSSLPMTSFWWILAVLMPLLIVVLVFHITSDNNESTNTVEALEFHHIVITAGNGFMLLLSYIMKQDAQSTSQDLDDLETKQYQYKSL